MKFKRHTAALLLVILFLSIPIVQSLTFDQKINYVAQTITNVPYYYVDNNLSNVDFSGDKGTHSNFTAQQHSPDSLFDSLTEENMGKDGAIEDYVDNNTSNVDNSADVGSHSDFSAQQSGPDAVYDTLTEENTGGSSNSTLLDDGFEDFIWDANWNDIYSNWREDNYPVHSGSASAWASDYYEGYFTCDNLDASGATAIYVDFWFRKTGTDYYDFTLFYYDGSNYDLIDELADNGGDNTWLHYTAKITDSQYFVSNFRIRFDATIGFLEEVWIDDVVITKENQGNNNYELDLEVQFTNILVDFLPIEELCIYAGTLGDENLNVDYWNGASWENLATDLTTNSWNNYTVSLASTTFTVRFNDGTETGDTIEDSWEIDAILLSCQGTGSREDAVDSDASDVDSSADKGNHSNFSAQQSGPDSIYDMLTEVDNTGTVWLWQEDTSGYSSTSSYETYQFWNSWTTNSTTSGTITKIGIYVFADPGNSPQVKLGIYDDSNGSPNNLLGETNAATITGTGWLDLDIIGSGVNISASTTYHIAHITDIAPTTQWRYLKAATPVSDYRGNRVWPNLFDPAGITSKSSSYRYGAYRVGYDEPSNYELDLEVQWTDIPYSLPNEELSIYGGTMGDEDVVVDVWNGTGWETIFTDLSSGWNNVSISEWLTTSTFTIRFSGGTEVGDASSDTWQIDVALIHVWNEGENYELDLEVQWTNVDYSEANEELCVYGGPMDAEDIRVDVWNGSSWVNVFTDLNTGWNNVTVSSYLTSSTFTIRFKGGTETIDTTQDYWNIDTTLLHAWT